MEFPTPVTSSTSSGASIFLRKPNKKVIRIVQDNTSTGYMLIE